MDNPHADNQTSSVQPADTLEDLIRVVPFFEGLHRIDLARLIGALEWIQIPAGMRIFAEDADADALYLLETGRVRVTVAAADEERPLVELGAPAYFGELGLLLRRRTASAQALTNVTAWKLPRQRFEQLVRDRPAIGIAAAASLAELVDRRSRERVGAPTGRAGERSITRQPVRFERTPVWQMAGTAFAIGVPLVLWRLTPPSGLSLQGWQISLVVIGSALAWLFRPLPDYGVAVLMATVWGVTGLAPLPLIFGGFASSTWVVALGALGLAAVMAESGLLFRIALFLLKTFPATHTGQVLALLFSGLVVTPLVPLATARVAAIAPLTKELAYAMGYPVRSRASAALAFAGLLGYGGFNSIFLTGLATNFFVVGLLSPADRAHFGWLVWLAGAVVVGVGILIGAALALLGIFQAEVPSKATPEVLRRQMRALGPLTRREEATVLALAVLLLGLLLQPLLRVDTAWLALLALAIAMGGGGLDRERFRSAIDWGFLVLFGLLLGTGGVLHNAGVDRWIAEGLLPLTKVLAPPWLVVFLAMLVIVCRLILPRSPAIFLLSLALVPAASRLGLSPWIVGFVILVAANTWLHPILSDFYRLTKEATGDGMFTDRHGFIMGGALTVVTLLAITASIPYWQAIGLLSR